MELPQAAGPELEFPKQEIFDIPGLFYLRNVPALDNLHLLDGDFKIVRRLEEVPDACMRTFESSFVNINSLRAKQGEVRRVGEYRQTAKDLRELRQMLFQHRFGDGSGC